MDWPASYDKISSPHSINPHVALWVVVVKVRDSQRITQKN